MKFIQEPHIATKPTERTNHSENTQFKNLVRKLVSQSPIPKSLYKDAVRELENRAGARVHKKKRGSDFHGRKSLEDYELEEIVQSEAKTLIKEFDDGTHEHLWKTLRHKQRRSH